MKAGRKAFTLLEVLLALVIFAGSATYLSMAYMNVLLNFENSRSRANFVEELSYAREHIQLMSDLEEVEKGGEFDMGNNRGGSWMPEIEYTTIPDLFKVKLQVLLVDSEGAEFEMVEEFYLLRPTWSDPDERNELSQEMEELIRSDRDDQQWGWGFSGS